MATTIVLYENSKFAYSTGNNSSYYYDAVTRDFPMVFYKMDEKNIVNGTVMVDSMSWTD